MKIAYISKEDPFDKKAWSGLIFSIMNCLKTAGLTVTTIGPLNDYSRIKEVLKREFYKYFYKQKFDSNRTINLSKSYARQIERKIRKDFFDLIFVSDPTLIAYIKTDIPIILWTDGTFKSYYDLYFKNERIHPNTLKQGNILESEAFQKSRYLFFSSNWAAEYAKNYYPQHKNKIKIIPFGCNFENVPSKEQIINSLKKKNLSKIKLISVGVDWKRKGMNYSVELVRYLNDQGIKSELTIVGCKPPSNYKNLNYIKIRGFIDKNNSLGEKELSELYLNSHFNLLFSEAEAFGVVLTEANAHGVPNITFDVGGISSIINNRGGGKIFPRSTPMKTVGDFIIDIIKNEKNYTDFCLDSLKRYEEELNWNSSGRKVIQYLKNNF